MEGEFAHETPIARFPTPETELYLSKESLQRRKELGDTPTIQQHNPETNIKEVTSEITEEHKARSENSTDEMSIFHPDDDELEMSDNDDPNLSGLSHLDPDPSLGCLPRGFAKQRSTTRTYVAPEEPPQLRAWNYLTRRNIIELFEEVTAELFLHRFPIPVDYMIEATERARLKNQQEESSAQNRSARDRTIGSGSTDTLSAEVMSVAVRESGVRLFPSQEDYINGVILLATQYDVSSYGSGTKTAKEDEAKVTDKDDVSVYAPQDEADDDVKGFGGKTLVSGDDPSRVSGFSNDDSPQVELEFKTEVEKCDVKSPADESNGPTPRVITSTEAIKILNYLA